MKVVSRIEMSRAWKNAAHSIEGGQSDVAARLLDRGEWHGQQCGEPDIIKADDSEVLGHFEIESGEGLQELGGGVVVGADDGVVLAAGGEFHGIGVRHGNWKAILGHGLWRYQRHQKHAEYVNADYHPEPDSPAIQKLGFKPLPIGQMGIVK